MFIKSKMTTKNLQITQDNAHNRSDFLMFMNLSFKIIFFITVDHNFTLFETFSNGDCSFLQSYYTQMSMGVDWCQWGDLLFKHAWYVKDDKCYRAISNYWLLSIVSYLLILSMLLSDLLWWRPPEIQLFPRFHLLIYSRRRIDFRRFTI